MLSLYFAHNKPDKLIGYFERILRAIASQWQIMRSAYCAFLHRYILNVGTAQHYVLHAVRPALNTPLSLIKRDSVKGTMDNNADEDVKSSSKTRTSAKEAVSSRWATRAQQSNRKPPNQKPTQQISNPQPTNLLCQTWKQVQEAVGFQLLRHLAH